MRVGHVQYQSNQGPFACSAVWKCYIPGSLGAQSCVETAIGAARKLFVTAFGPLAHHVRSVPCGVAGVNISALLIMKQMHCVDMKAVAARSGAKAHVHTEISTPPSSIPAWLDL